VSGFDGVAAPWAVLCDGVQVPSVGVIVISRSAGCWTTSHVNGAG